MGEGKWTHIHSDGEKNKYQQLSAEQFKSVFREIFNTKNVSNVCTSNSNARSLFEKDNLTSLTMPAQRHSFN